MRHFIFQDLFRVITTSATPKESTEPEFESFKYVSMGGYELEAFISKFEFDFKNKLILDLRCSLAGFSDFFLQKSTFVFGVDVNDAVEKKVKENPI